MTPYVMREAFRTNAPDKLLEFYRTVQDILHNKSMTEIEQLNRIRIMAGAAAANKSSSAEPKLLYLWPCKNLAPCIPPASRRSTA